MKKGCDVLCARMLLAILLAVSMAACTPRAPESGTKGGAALKIKAVVLPYTSSGPLFIAQEEGFFAAQGLEVEFVRMESGSSPLAALAQGEVDVAASGPTVGVLNAIAQGGRIRIVADKGRYDPKGGTYMAFLARPEWIAGNPLSRPAGLKGLRVSVDPTNFEAFMLDRILAGSGVSLHDLSIQDISPPALTEAVGTYAVDLISIGEPWVTRLLDTGKVTVWQPAQTVAPDFQFGVILFGRSLIDGDPARGRRFLTAYLQGVRQYNLGKTDRNVEIMAKYTSLDPGLLRRACWPAMAPDGKINVDSILEFQTWALDKGLIDKPARADQLWNASFLDYARTHGGTNR